MIDSEQQIPSTHRCRELQRKTVCGLLSWVVCLHLSILIPALVKSKHTLGDQLEYTSHTRRGHGSLLFFSHLSYMAPSTPSPFPAGVFVPLITAPMHSNDPSLAQSPPSPFPMSAFAPGRAASFARLKATLRIVVNGTGLTAGGC